MSFHQQLLTATEPQRRQLLSIPVVCAALDGRVTLPTYRAFLTEAYHHVRHTVPLLMACGARLPARLEWLRTAVAEYIEEEVGHQEWILNDLAACGVDPESVREGEPAAATELMVAYAYDTVARGNPAGLFGMVLVLEGTSVALALDAASALQQSLGLPDSAFSYLRSHGAADQEHIRFFAGLMDRLTDSGDQQAVVHAARRFYDLYGDIFRSLPHPAAERSAA